jgi:hypothetical protein
MNITMYTFLVGSPYTEQHSVKDGRGKSLLKVSISQFFISSLRNMRKFAGDIPHFLGEIRTGYSPVGAGIA